MQAFVIDGDTRPITDDRTGTGRITAYDDQIITAIEPDLHEKVGTEVFDMMDDAGKRRFCLPRQPRSFRAEGRMDALA